MPSKNPSIRVRFAPSPTGFLHIGGARTALFNWLFARHHGGAFILRIEDTDEVRSTLESVDGILKSMEWLGLDWDEGPDLHLAEPAHWIPEKEGSQDRFGLGFRGRYGPYFQMQRLEKYQSACDALIAQGLAYPCYCTPEEVEKMRQIALLAKRPPRYDGTCRKLSAEGRRQKEAQGRKKSIRFRSPTEGSTDFRDLIHGPKSFENALLEDFVILKTSGVPTYNFACVIDDRHMAISHVIRGDDHLSNTPRQILVYRALGWEPPQFAHLAMILGSDGARLSKRHGATSVSEYQQAGYLPEALLNYLALLGWGTEDSQQLFTREEMIRKFELERCGKSAATFDPNKLIWMNGEYVRNTPLDRLADLGRPFFRSPHAIDGILAERYRAALALEQGKVKLLADIPRLVDFLLWDDFAYREEAVDKVLRRPGADEVLEALGARLKALEPFDAAAIETLCKSLARERGVNNGAVFHPLRVAASGRTEGPSLFHFIEFLGREKTLARINRARELLRKGDRTHV